VSREKKEIELLGGKSLIDRRKTREMEKESNSSGEFGEL
jgi:hypothetical protein